MDLSYALRWMVGTSAFFGLVMSVKQLRVGRSGWFVTNAMLLSVLGIGAYLDWPPIGYVAFVLWWLFSIVPNYADRCVLQALQHQQLPRANRWAHIAALLHPFDGQRERMRFVSSHYLWDAGDFTGAKGALYSLLREPEWAELAKLELLSIDGRWNEIVDHAMAARVGTRDLRLAPLYLRALGETSATAPMWKMYSEIPAALARQPVIRLQMASYTGLTHEVDRLLRLHFPATKATRMDTARAIATMVADQRDESDRILHEQQELGGPFAIHAAWRRAHPLPAVDLSGLSPTTQTRIADFRRDVASMSQLAAPHTISERRAWVTVGLIASMLLVFALGLPGGTMDPENLVRLGALILPSDLGEGGVLWRVVAAGFLHLGATHLLMNCLGLWVLGKQIEELWNGLSMLSIFLASSIGSFAFAATFVKATEQEPRIFLGASSGVMGLVGALGAYLAVGYWRHRRPTIGGRLLIVVAIVVAQLVFDWFTPIVSSMLHMTGLLIGACVGTPLAMRSWRGRSPR